MIDILPHSYKGLGLGCWFIVLSTQSVTAIALISVVILCTRLVFTGLLDLTGLILSWPIVGLVIQGLAFGAFNPDVAIWDYARDALYLAKVPLIAMASLTLVGRDLSVQEFSSAIIAAGLILAAVYLAKYIAFDGAAMSRRELRITIGRGYFILVFSILALFFSQSWVVLRATLIGFLLLAIFASTSRTLPATLILYGLVALWLWGRGPILPLVFVSLGAVTVFSFPPAIAQIGTVLLHWNVPGLREFAHELATTQFGDFSAIQDAFRAYEARMAWHTFAAAPIGAQIFGAGFGSLVDLGTHVTLGLTVLDQETHQSVPITHVSIMTALLKFGWIGLPLYIYAVIPFTWTKDSGPGEHFTLVLNLGSVLILIYVILVFQGFFATLDILNILVAMLALTHVRLLHTEKL